MKASMSQHDTDPPLRRDIVTLGQEVSRLQDRLASIERDRALSDVARVCGERDEAQAGAAAMREALEGIAEDPGCGCTPCTGACQTKDTLRDELVEIREQAHAALQSTAGRALLERLERAERERDGSYEMLSEVVATDDQDPAGCIMRGTPDLPERWQRLTRDLGAARADVSVLESIKTALSTDLEAVHAELDAARDNLAALRAVPAGTEAELARLRARVQDRDHIAAIVHTSWCAKVHSEPESEDYAAADVLVSWLTGKPRLATHVSERVRASVEADDTATPLLAGPGAIIPEMREIGEAYCGAGDDGWMCSAKAGHTEPMHAAYGRRTDSPLHVWPVASPTRYPADLSVPTLTEAVAVAAAALIPSTPSESVRESVREQWRARYGTRQAPVFVGPRQDMATGSSPVPAGCCAECRQREGHLMGCEHGAAIQPDVDAIVNTNAQETA